VVWGEWSGQGWGLNSGRGLGECSEAVAFPNRWARADVGRVASDDVAGMASARKSRGVLGLGWARDNVPWGKRDREMTNRSPPRRCKRAGVRGIEQGLCGGPAVWQGTQRGKNLKEFWKKIKPRLPDKF
jgi:hypothetical protein